MTEKVKRPNRTTMEGMIWNANHILQDALRPGIRGIPKSFFMESVGVAIISVVDIGLVFSGTVGTGILMAHMDDDSWSSPVACGLSGVGFGLLMGVAAKDIIVFFPDASSIKTFFGTGVQLNAKYDLTVGVGREFDAAVGWSTKGSSAVISFAYTKGAFACLALETAVLGPRKAVNTHFYGKKVDDLMDIIKNKVKFPKDKHTLLPEVHEKLKKLSQGVSETPAQAEAAKLEAARVAADEASHEAHEFHKTEGEEIVEVDAEKEAAKDPVDELTLSSATIDPPDDAEPAASVAAASVSAPDDAASAAVASVSARESEPSASVAEKAPEPASEAPKTPDDAVPTASVAEKAPEPAPEKSEPSASVAEKAPEPASDAPKTE